MGVVLPLFEERGTTLNIASMKNMQKACLFLFVCEKLVGWWRVLDASAERLFTIGETVIKKYLQIK